MPKTVSVAGLGDVDFPDEMTDVEIKGVLDRQYGPKQPTHNFTKSGYAALSGGAGAVADVGTALSALSDPGPLRNNFRNFQHQMDIAGQRDVSPDAALSILQSGQERQRQRLQAPGQFLQDRANLYSQGAQAISTETPGNEHVAAFAKAAGGMIPLLATAAIPVVGPEAAVGMGGLQSAGGTYNDAFAAYKKMGLSDEKAKAKAEDDAISVGLNSAAIYTLLPGSGKVAVEDLFHSQMGKLSPLMRGAVRTLAKGADGSLVMGADSLLRSAQEQRTYNPDLTLQEALDKAAKSAIAGGVAAAAVHAPIEAWRAAKPTLENWKRRLQPPDEATVVDENRPQIPESVPRRFSAGQEAGHTVDTDIVSPGELTEFQRNVAATEDPRRKAATVAAATAKPPTEIRPIFISNGTTWYRNDQGQWQTDKPTGTFQTGVLTGKNTAEQSIISDLDLKEKAGEAKGQRGTPGYQQIINDAVGISRQQAESAGAQDLTRREIIENSLWQRLRSPMFMFRKVGIPIQVIEKIFSPENEYGPKGEMGLLQQHKLEGFGQYLAGENDTAMLERFWQQMKDVEPKYPYDIAVKQMVGEKLGHLQPVAPAAPAPQKLIGGGPTRQLTNLRGESSNATPTQPDQGGVPGQPAGGDARGQAPETSTGNSLQRNAPGQPGATAKANDTLKSALEEIPENIRREITVKGIKTGVSFPSTMEGAGALLHKSGYILFEDGEPITRETVLHELLHDYVLKHPELYSLNDYHGMEKAVDKLHSEIIAKRKPASGHNVAGATAKAPVGDESTGFESTESLVARTSLENRADAFKARAEALKRVRSGLKKGDILIDEDGRRLVVADVPIRGDAVFVHEEGVTGTDKTGYEFHLEPGMKIERSSPLNPGGAESSLSPELQAKSRANNEAMRAQFEALKKQALQPKPDWRVAVQAPQGDVPGNVQLIDPRQTETSKSPTVESVKAAGHAVPDFSKLPQGSYTWEEAVKLLESQNKLAEKPATPKYTANQIRVAEANTMFLGWTFHEREGLSPEQDKLSGWEFTQDKTGKKLYFPKGTDPMDIVGELQKNPAPIDVNRWTSVQPQPVAKAADKVKKQVIKTAKAKGTRSAKEIKDDIIAQVTAGMEKAPNQTASITFLQGELGRLSPSAKSKRATLEEKIRVLIRASPTVTYDIPGDGEFTIPNTKEHHAEMLARANALDTRSGLRGPEIKRRGTSDEDKEFIANALANPQGNPNYQPWPKFLTNFWEGPEPDSDNPKMIGSALHPDKIAKSKYSRQFLIDAINKLLDQKVSPSEILNALKGARTTNAFVGNMRNLGSIGTRPPGENYKGTTLSANVPGESKGHALVSGVIKEIYDPLKKFAQDDIAPIVKQGYNAAKAAQALFVDWFAPTTRVKPSNLDILMESKGYKEHLMVQAAAALESSKKILDKMTNEDQIAFIDRIKRGEKQPTQQLQQLAEVLRKWDDRLYQEASKYKPDLNYLDNHYRVLWKVLPGAEGLKGAQLEYFMSKRPWQGSKGFLLRHTLADMSEGIAKGGVPVSYNPVDMFLLHAQDVMKFVAANRAWEDLKKSGTAEFVEKGNRPPEGYVRIDDKISKQYFRTQEKKPGEWYVEENTARLINNYLSHDWFRQGKTGAIGRALLDLKNLTTNIELGLSGFHAVFVTNDAVASGIGLAIQKMFTQGMFKEGARELATSLPGAIPYVGGFLPGTTSFEAVKAGAKLEKAAKAESPEEFKRNYPDAYKFLADRYPDFEHMVNDLFSGGAKIGMSDDYRVQALKGFREAVKNDNLIGAMARAVPAVNTKMLSPIFQMYIPRLKLGVWLREYAFELKRRAADLESGKISRGQLARQTWDFVEDRFGELNFDNLWWNRTFKSANQLAFRSVTWKLGNTRAFGKAGRDFYQQIGKSGVDWARTGNVPNPRVTGPLAWVVGMALTTVIQAAIMSKLFSGKYPWQWGGDSGEQLKNITYPRIDPNDESQRISIPTYWKDATHATRSILHQDLDYLKSSMTGEIGRMWDIFQNKDFYGNKVYNEDDPFYHRDLNKVEHLIPLPFSFSSVAAAKKSGETGIRTALGLTGYTKAPYYVSHSHAEQKAAELLRAELPVEGRTAEQQKIGDKERQAIMSIKRGEMTVYDAVQQGLMKPSQANNVRLQAEIPHLQYQIRRLTAEKTLAVWKEATPKEKALIETDFANKIANMHIETGEDQAKQRFLFGQIRDDVSPGLRAEIDDFLKPQ